MKQIFLLLQLYMFCIVISATEVPIQQRKLLISLDSLLLQKDYFVTIKEERILQIKQQLERASLLEEQYLMNKLIYEEYRVYKADSALYYIQKNKKIAKQTENEEWLVASLIEESFVLLASGLLKESLEVINNISANELSRELRSRYYGQMKSLYVRMRDYSNGNPGLWKLYDDMHKNYVDSILLVGNTNELRYLFSAAWRHIGTDKVVPYKEALENKLNTFSVDTRNYAMTNYNLAAIYKLEKKENLYLQHLIFAAMSDIRCANGDIEALQELAEYLFHHGDIDRAYTYVNYCMQNAQSYHNRVRLISASKLQNSIHHSYQEQIKEHQHGLRISLVIVSLLSIILIGAVFFIRRQMKYLAVSSSKLHEVNDILYKHTEELSETQLSLRDANIKLQDLNKQLQEVNVQLQESNYVKEEYIGYVFNICSSYISKLDDYRKNINRKLRVGQIEEAKNMTDNSIVASEIKEFYQNFDSIFLHLYPDFVENFNALLMPDERVELKDGELLNTELRIHVLIRLGITDSVKIANFLHCSTQTIYNNRLRSRNKSIIAKEDFSSAVKRLGKHKY